MSSYSEQYVLDKGARLPKRRKTKPAIPPSAKKAMEEYTEAYQRVFKRKPVLCYVDGYIRTDGAPGVQYKRLKELTRQLRERAREL